MIRRQPGIDALLHGQVSLLEVAGEASGVEQRMGHPVAGQARPEFAEGGRIRGQFERPRLVGGEAAGDQFGQAEGTQQAAGHARREGAAGAGEDRDAGP